MKRLFVVISIVVLLVSCNYSDQASYTVEGIKNHNFETGDLTGWKVISGNAFSDGDVTNSSSWGWDGPFNQSDKYHLWGYADGGDNQVGVLRSQSFILKGNGQIDLLIGGGKDINKFSKSKR
ncbi:hypothetical protein JCM16358_24490 [Halanaerocella petrolearia]